MFPIPAPTPPVCSPSVACSVATTVASRALASSTRPVSDTGAACVPVSFVMSALGVEAVEPSILDFDSPWGSWCDGSSVTLAVDGEGVGPQIRSWFSFCTSCRVLNFCPFLLGSVASQFSTALSPRKKSPTVVPSFVSAPGAALAAVLVSFSAPAYAPDASA